MTERKLMRSVRSPMTTAKMRKVHQSSKRKRRKRRTSSRTGRRMETLPQTSRKRKRRKGAAMKASDSACETFTSRLKVGLNLRLGSLC